MRLRSSWLSLAGGFLQVLLLMGGMGSGSMALQAAEEGRLVIITPHNEAIRYEFSQAFTRWHQALYGDPAGIEWRDTGGSSDALRFVQSEFARKPEGIGIDCFFGGGHEPYLVLSDRQLLQAYSPPTNIMAGIPSHIVGIELYDPSHRWHAVVLSSFGILQSDLVEKLVGLPAVTRWDELAQPQLLGWVGAGDPRNSGTMTTMFESFLQAYGWEKGWQLLTRLAGNVRKFDRIASQTAKDVTLGETAYGLAIDFYAFSQLAVAGRSNLTFILPEDFTTISIDGLAILRGAPHPELARRFVDFALSEDGQRLWFLPKGHPLGPRRYSMERMVVRPDFYEKYKSESNIEISPFKLKEALHYDGEKARQRREVVAGLVGALLVDTHSELRAAWRAMIQRGLTAPDLKVFGSMPLSESEALAIAKSTWKDPAARNRQRIDWQRWAQQKYHHLLNSTGPLAKP